MKKTILIFAALCGIFGSCKKEAGISSISLLPEDNFKTELDGKSISLYTLSNGKITMQVTNFGARVVSIWTPDRKGKYADIATGYDNINMYIDNPGERFLGAAVGPVANRIGKGIFSIGNEVFNLPLNNDGNTLHGGFTGLDMVVWEVIESNESSILFAYTHPDGFEGWPGNLQIKMRYSVTPDDEFKIEYEAVTDKETPVNISNHAFFNLTGCSDKSILNHEIMINASKTTPVDNLLIPTGEIVSLDGSPLDFRQSKPIGRDVNLDDQQLKNGNGYDHNWCLDRKTDNGIELAAVLYEPESGRVMEVLTDQPGLQFYCGNFFDGTTKDKYGKTIGYRCSLALETQKYPDGVNHANFPNTILKPGETYTHTCIYRFSTK